jgi:hypothetical protein
MAHQGGFKGEKVPRNTNPTTTTICKPLELLHCLFNRFKKARIKPSLNTRTDVQTFSHLGITQCLPPTNEKQPVESTIASLKFCAVLYYGFSIRWISKFTKGNRNSES